MTQRPTAEQLATWRKNSPGWNVIEALLAEIDALVAEADSLRQDQDAFQFAINKLTQEVAVAATSKRIALGLADEKLEIAMTGRNAAEAKVETLRERALMLAKAYYETEAFTAIGDTDDRAQAELFGVVRELLESDLPRHERSEGLLDWIYGWGMDTHRGLPPGPLRVETMNELTEIATRLAERRVPCPSTMCGPEKYNIPDAVPVGHWLAGDIPTPCEVCDATGTILDPRYSALRGEHEVEDDTFNSSWSGRRYCRNCDAESSARKDDWPKGYCLRTDLGAGVRVTEEVCGHCVIHITFEGDPRRHYVTLHGSKLNQSYSGEGDTLELALFRAIDAA
jgi:hypothetical protein